MATPRRGEVWMVRFDPSEGDEIRKTRPAVVMSIGSVGRMRLHLVVPITGWKNHFAPYFELIQLLPSAQNGLSIESAADAFQLKSMSTQRFQSKLGTLTDGELDEIADAIALCIGYRR